MGLFDEQLTALEHYVAAAREAGTLQELDLATGAGWPTGRRIVLQADTALDLGSPAAGSVTLLMWAPVDPEHAPTPDRILLVGPDVSALAAASQGPAPFGQAVVVHGTMENDYQAYLVLREALHDIAPEGLTLRSMPSQQHLWCRLHTDALARGFSFAHLGAALVSRLRDLELVHRVDVLLHTAGRDELAPLRTIADAAGRAIGALVKRHEEENAECDECEYSDICDEKEHVS